MCEKCKEQQQLLGKTVGDFQKELEEASLKAIARFESLGPGNTAEQHQAQTEEALRVYNKWQDIAKRHIGGAIEEKIEERGKALDEASAMLTLEDLFYEMTAIQFLATGATVLANRLMEEVPERLRNAFTLAQAEKNTPATMVA